MTPLLIGSLVIKDDTGQNPNLHKVYVAYKIRHSNEVWHCKQMGCDGWPPDYFFETVAKIGRPVNATEVNLFFSKALNTNHYEQPV